MIAAYAVAITPDILGSKSPIITKCVIYSANKKTICASTIVSVISTCSLLLIRLITVANSIPNTVHKIIHHMTIIPKSPNHHQISQASNIPLENISNMTRNTATAIPSLNKLSHSKMSHNLLGTQRSLNIASTATGSVDEIMTPNKSMTCIGICIPANHNKYHHHHHTIIVEIVSPTIASVRMGI